VLGGGVVGAPAGGRRGPRDRRAEAVAAPAAGGDASDGASVATDARRTGTPTTTPAAARA